MLTSWLAGLQMGYDTRVWLSRLEEEKVDKEEETAGPKSPLGGVQENWEIYHLLSSGATCRGTKRY